MLVSTHVVCERLSVMQELAWAEDFVLQIPSLPYSWGTKNTTPPQKKEN